METAAPYAWPCGGPLDADSTALILIDMQIDFCGVGGYVDRMGYDISATRAPIKPLQHVLSAARTAGVRVIHTREGHRPSLADLPENKRLRSAAIGTEIGQLGPCGRVLVRGEPGNAIIPQLEPAAGEPVVHKPGKGAFYSTDLDATLKGLGVSHLLVAGVTTEVCVQTTLREANDRGYNCLLVADASASYFDALHDATIEMVVAQGGIVGWAAQSADVVRALQAR